MGRLAIGRKLGMTRWYTEDGVSMPVTVLEVEKCVVTQIKTPEKDGYAAIQIGAGEKKPRRATFSQIGHDGAAGTGPKAVHREFRVDPSDLESYELGQEIGAELFETMAFVDVAATSKGKGFQGGMKRHNFRGQEASHGVERKHRSAGSIGGHATNLGTGPKIKKGKRMAGHMGDVRTTVRSLDVVSVDTDKGLVLVKGSVPGANKGFVEIREPSRLYGPKARKQAEKAG